MNKTARFMVSILNPVRFTRSGCLGMMPDLRRCEEIRVPRNLPTACRKFKKCGYGRV